MKPLQWIPFLVVMIAVCMAFTSKGKKKVASPDGFVYIPSGTLWELELPYSGQEEVAKKKKLAHIQGFFMKETEVSNKEYRAYLADLKKSGRLEEWKKALPDTTVWTVNNSKNAPFVNTYFRHPAYEDYPVVGVSLEAAKMYCKWLDKKLKSEKNKKKKIGEDLMVRLPTKNEWMHAARGGDEQAIFPWEGKYMQDDKGRRLANYANVPQHLIKRDRGANDYEVVLETSEWRPHITAPVDAYRPNEYGLYCMAGNAAEWLLDGGTKGGSHSSSGYYMQIDAEEEFPDIAGAGSKDIGFRPVLEVVATSVPSPDK